MWLPASGQLDQGKICGKVQKNEKLIEFWTRVDQGIQELLSRRHMKGV